MAYDQPAQVIMELRWRQANKHWHLQTMLYQNGSYTVLQSRDLECQAPLGVDAISLLGRALEDRLEAMLPFEDY